MMCCRKWRGLVTAVVLVVVATTAFAQQRTKVYIGEIRGDDPFMAERYRLLFMESLSKMKTIELVEEREHATFVLDGIGKMETRYVSGFSGSAAGQFAGVSGGAGEVPNAMLSIQLRNQETKQVLYVGNQSTGPDRMRGASQRAVEELVKDIKKRLKWK